MCSNSVINVTNIGKCYEIYQAPHHRLFQTLLQGRKQFYKEFWAIKNISFEVNKGECIGIVGRNGCGKSTLLQIIAGILSPSLGELKVKGNISALLELGSGFNPEFTGRENIYMNGAILGLTKNEVDEKFQEIADFADIGDFIEQPVKIYSSGMFVRLAFSVATSTNPEILIVDEALSVGDMYFQSKCMDKIRQMMSNGCSTLFVSHNMETVKSLCDRAIFLEDGELKGIGKPDKIVNLYHGTVTTEVIKHPENTTDKSLDSVSCISMNSDSQTLQSKFSVNPKFDTMSPEDKYGDGKVRIRNVQLLNLEENEINVVGFMEAIIVRCHLEFFADSDNYNVGFLCRDLNGVNIFGTRTNETVKDIPGKKSGDKSIVDFIFHNRLGNGIYTLSVAVTNREKILLTDYHEWINNAVTFQSEVPPNHTCGLIYQEMESVSIL